MEKTRQLASVQVISNIETIKGKDRIVLASVKGWKVVVQNTVSVGDKVIYVEIDSALPKGNPAWESVFKYGKKIIDGQECHVLKTSIIGGNRSQGLILDIKTALDKDPDDFNIDDDVTDLLGVFKYEPELPKELLGEARGRISGKIQKTGEYRFQSLKEENVDRIKEHRYKITEKVEGTSFTAYIDPDDKSLHVCSREVDFIKKDDNVYWKAASESGIVNYLITEYEESERCLCVQGELVVSAGPQSQYKLPNPKIFVFYIWDIVEGVRLPWEEVCDMCHIYQEGRGTCLSTVPLLGYVHLGDKTNEEIIKMADGPSLINPASRREGIVCEPDLENATPSEDLFFKVVSNEYLEKGWKLS